MKDVLALVTLQPMMRRIQKTLMDEHMTRIDVRYCKNLHGIMEYIDKKIASDIEVIVTTPGPSFFIAPLIKKKLPIITLEYNNIDIIKALRMALAACPGTVAFGHYLQETPWLSDIQQLVGQGFGNFVFGSDDAINADILKALHAQGTRGIAGGGYICNIAQELGFLVFPVEVNRFTIKETLHRAVALADTQKAARYSQKNIDIILNNQAEAVVTVDEDAVITFFNKRAETLFGVSGAAAIGRASRKVLPHSLFETALQRGEPVETHPHTVHGVDLVGSYRPVFDTSQVIGAVGTFSTVMDIRKKDEVVRTYYAPKTAQAKYVFDDLYGRGPVFQGMLERARCFARSDETVLITGESGTGKELMAGSLHNASRRSHKPFLSINSAAIPATLMESELFGYEAGAFTGGKKDGSPGLFEFAQGGTLFLDEIGEMPLDLQAKLLRVIQEKEIRRLGSARVIAVDVRLIAATNRNLRAEVAANRFRADLYYRLNILQLHMPALREYAEQIGDIAERMLQRLAPGAGQAAGARLRELLAQPIDYGWPGNWRELENLVRRYIALSPYLARTIQLADIFDPDIMAAESPEPASDESAEAHLLATYHRFACNKTLTAQALGMSRSTLWRRLRRMQQA